MIWYAVFIAVTVYVGLAAIMYFNQKAYVYFPSRVLVTNPREAAGLNYEDVRITTRDGLSLHGWFIAAAEARNTLLFFHGNAGNISHRIDSLRLFHELGLSTFILDYRGYGRSEGTADEAGTYEDALAAWDYLTEQRGVPADQVILFGRSLGGAVAAWLATRRVSAGLILESTFSSLPELGAYHYPWLPVRLLSKLKYDTHSRLAEISVPVLIVHSREDTLIPFDHAKQLRYAHHHIRPLLEIRGDHNAGFLISGDDYRHGIGDFVASLQPDPATESTAEP